MAASPKARADLDVVELGAETVTYDARSRRLHYLNPSAALVFTLCDGTTRVADMADAISGVYDLPAEAILTEVRRTVRELRKLELLEPTRSKARTAGARNAPEDRRETTRLEVPKNT
jgi:pyrroloquinoline quinone biosynthesis protein D